MRFQKINNITGWVMFGIAMITYWLTFEETGSYWDCGEFIAVAYKLEVSHPPGAPLFMLLGRIFSFLAFGDVTKVAYWINFLSVLSSAFTILFLFWSITLFGRKIMGASRLSDLTEDKIWILMGAGAVGSLAYTFSDSFWFSAVEAEVYAMSSFFTAFVVWGILKWDVIEDDQKGNKWLIFVAYMVGLSIGVHLLNLVALPALGLIIYFKKYKPTAFGIIAALAISLMLVLFINNLIIPGLPTIAGSFEVFFINTMGLPFGSGVIIFCVLFVAALVFGIRYSHVNNKPLLNTFLLSTTFILIGYCSYATIVIRSNFDTSINENAPKDVMSFVRYLNREQYGSRPLLKGPYFTAKLIDVEYGDPVYVKGKEKYEISEKKFSYVYEPDQVTVFPRAWNSEHAETYRQIMGLREGQKPTFGQNLAFMFRHQIGTMYVRYVMWNFAGRQSDVQGSDWLSPAQWGEKLPYDLAINKGRNNFFMIPFVLGLIGMFYQATKDVKNFAVVGLLFIMLGVAIVVYLNSPPVEPRERDYIYAGSTYAFTFWIGFSIIAIAESLAKVIKNWKVVALTATVIGLSAPAIMAEQGWDDHNRSNRFYSVDSAKNYLDSCAPNAILFTGGDNDTFPLWYAQEVEGYRTDVRVIVLSYYNTDWYIAETMEKSYESEKFPYTLSLHQYRQGGPNDYLRMEDLTRGKAIDLKQYIGLLGKDFAQLRNGDANIVPSKMLNLTVDVDDVKKKGIVPKEMDSLIVPYMQFRLTKAALEKKDLAFLDLLATNNWERPIYMNNTSKSQMSFDLEPYVVQEGNAFRVLPIRRPKGNKDFVSTEIAYNNMINKFHYRGLDDPKVYYNDDYKGFVFNQRSSLNSLAEQLIDNYNAGKSKTGEKIAFEGPGENLMEKARKVLMFSLEKMPDKAVPYDINDVTTVDLLFKVGEKEKALSIAKTLCDRAIEMCEYLVKKNDAGSIEMRRGLFALGNTYQVLQENGESELGKKYEDAYEKYVAALQGSR